jgi:CBS domain-containing protein
MDRSSPAQAPRAGERGVRPWWPEGIRGAIVGMEGATMVRNPERFDPVTEESPLGAIVRHPTVSVAEHATLAEAVAMMENHEVSALLVLAGTDEGSGRPVGIVTERDVVRALARGAGIDREVGEVATHTPVIVAQEVSILTACAVMLSEDIRHLVVLGDDDVAIVSLRDVATVLLQHADPHAWLASLRLTFGDPSELWIG